MEKKSTRYPVVTGLEKLLCYSEASNCDCIAIGHSCLLFMHKKHFEKLETNYNWLRKAMMKLSSQRTCKLLRQVPFFNDLSSHYLNRLGDVFVYCSYNKGNVIFNEGDQAEHFYLSPRKMFYYCETWPHLYLY